MTAKQVVDAAIAQGLTLTTAESCTGGMVSAAITEIAGASSIFERGFVTYSNEAKHELLSVSNSTLTTYGAVSEQVATEMAIGALNAAHADLAVSITGIAGPGGSEFKPEGRVCFALCGKNQQTLVQTVEFGAIGRSNVRKAATDYALMLFLSALSDS